jgi:TPP-dependent pyruvate/acetoin dehydrogenase alpha subunit
MTTSSLPAVAADPLQLLALYARMQLIRRFEERAIDLWKEGLVGGSLHPCIGQEAVAVGVCSTLRDDDVMTMTYRGRGQFLAKGGDPAAMLAELLGRAGGVCRGKGGPMHLCDLKRGILGANGIVGAGVPIAVGAAYALKREGGDRVAVTFFGDGATNQGAFHEGLNLAAVWKVPLVLVCENNRYAEMTPIRDTVAVERLAARATGHGIRAEQVDGYDVLAVQRAAAAAVGRARAGEGPTFLEVHTYRLTGHMVGDPEPYRSRDEVACEREKDPVPALRARMLACGLPEERLAQAEQEVEERLRMAERFARGSPLLADDLIGTDVWANP